MVIDVVNERNEKVGSVDLADGTFGPRVNTGAIWESVVHEQAAARRGTHATKNRALVSGSGRKPWRQKGTGRARVGEIRNPLWRKGGTVFGPQPRSYGYRLPRKVALAAVRSALLQRLADGAVVVLEAWPEDVAKTKAVASLVSRLAGAPPVLLVDHRPGAMLARSTRNLAGTRIVGSNRVTARDVMHARRLIVTRVALERLRDALAQPAVAEADA
jgi:large subunit ribosomal protein L4